MVDFDESKHEYRLDGIRVPSVTEVLRPCYDFSRVDADVLAAKGELGTAVHVACDLDDAGDLYEGSVHAKVRPYLDGYRLFKQHKCTNVVATERIVSHAALRYAGRLDLITDFDGARWTIDWKTPLAISPAVALQTAAYEAATPADLLPPPGMPRKRAALQLKDDGTYRLHPFSDPNDFATFVSFLNVFRWMERNLKK